MQDVDSAEEGIIAKFVAGDEDVRFSEETSRLAVVDLEWDHVRAVDILAVRARVCAVHDKGASCTFGCVISANAPETPRRS